ncbi:RICIN domain-containing protein [Streptomyces mirabilis]|uniref:RICIN domain-containing protein n=3 Tax=Streptomyces mirabilis TaxID=68239 RepID=UPI0037A0DBB7
MPLINETDASNPKAAPGPLAQPGLAAQREGRSKRQCDIRSTTTALAKGHQKSRGDASMLKLGKTKRTIAMAAATLSIAAGANIAGTGTAQADVTWPNGYYAEYWRPYEHYVINSQWDGNCLDDSLQYGLRMYPCNANSVAGGWQTWEVTQLDTNNDAQLKNVNTGRCLDWSPQYGLRPFTCYYSSYTGGWQSWKMARVATSYGATTQILQNQLPRYNECLDESQYGVRGYVCNKPSWSDGYQGWNFMDVS